MRSGLHGENGLDPVTSISILRTYVIPIMFYGLETLLPSGKSVETLEKQYKKMIKQILSLPINTDDPTISMDILIAQCPKIHMGRQFHIL
jgi:hypothetical protein